jgi:hypothetical protein
MSGINYKQKGIIMESGIGVVGIDHKEIGRPMELVREKVREWVAGMQRSARVVSLDGASLASHGSRLQFGVAVALISVIPFLALFYLFNLESGVALTPGSMWLVGGILSATVCLGYSLLLKYPITITRLRRHMEQIARGELPDRVKLANGECDISAIEDCFNQVVEGMKARIATMKEQSLRVVEAERQRVMVESLCTACHCLGQPATALECYLELLTREVVSTAGEEYVASCVSEAAKMRGILTELQGITEYRTESYCSTSGASSDTSLKIVPMRCDKAAMTPFATQQQQGPATSTRSSILIA